MHPNLQHLIELQSVDLKISDTRARLAVFPAQLAALDRRLSEARAELTRARDAHIQSLKDRKKYELDVESWKEKVRKYKDQVYQVKSNEAYKALQHEIQMAEEEIARSEDRLLEQMVAGEEYERQIKAAEKSLAEVEAAVRDERGAITGQQSAAEKELAGLEAERAQAIAALPEEMLDLYHRIARRHDGVALSEVRDETCTACRVRVRPHVFQELRNPASEAIIHCESCTRILYYLGDAAAQAPAQSEASGGASA